MSSENDRPPTNRIYFDHLHKGHSDLAMKLWGDIPSTMGDAVKILQRIRESYGSPPDELEDLKGLMKDNLRKMGGLTPWVSEKIDVMDAGVVESGQQPLCLGGTSLILNKIAYTWAFCDVPRTLCPCSTWQIMMASSQSSSMSDSLVHLQEGSSSIIPLTHLLRAPRYMPLILLRGAGSLISSSVWRGTIKGF